MKQEDDAAVMMVAECLWARHEFYPEQVDPNWAAEAWAGLPNGAKCRWMHVARGWPMRAVTGVAPERPPQAFLDSIPEGD